jgi:hypothetical protein
MAKEVTAMKNREVSGGKPETHCGVSEGKFPCLGTCCEDQKGAFGPEYRSICHCCSAMTLPPDSTTLDIATLFECSRYGYGRRMTDARPPKQTKNKENGGEI